MRRENSLMTKNKIVTNKGISIGKDSKTLLNLLIGANNKADIEKELKKINYLYSKSESIDIITDLSLYNNKEPLWEYVLKNTNYMAGTVPIYLSLGLNGLVDEKLLYEIICEQCEKGVSIITIHPTVNRELIQLSKKRIIPCTSRGGGIVAKDLLLKKREENVYIEIINKIAKKCADNNVIISIGSTFRSGSIEDAIDEVYFLELEEQLKIANQLTDMDVNTIIETPGHIDAKNLIMLCDKLNEIPFPIMPLGPMLTDIGFEEDDTVAVIGASLMGIHSCADILSIVTSREHLSGVPSIDEMISAISKYKIAKHIIDLAKIQDNKEDIYISRKRAKECSCNVMNGLECKRCGSVCPLRNNY